MQFIWRGADPEAAAAAVAARGPTTQPDQTPPKAEQRGGGVQMEVKLSSLGLGAPPPPGRLLANVRLQECGGEPGSGRPATAGPTALHSLHNDNTVLLQP
ncbi:hypothetical protein EYF80_048119 [Liparis tanakae]|uniref:Uncharacterized protein n=1 Tax=Liparis tanakae TaxID=230148 RepID=A0A4Z2FLC1_9TELE|nr:hypothetical protein EYF80_048119 [Liparis tanakae]